MRPQELQRIMSRSLELLSSDTRSSSGLLTDIDYMVVLRTFERQIESWYQHVINADSESRASNLFPFASLASLKQPAQFHYRTTRLVPLRLPHRRGLLHL